MNFEDLEDLIFILKFAKTKLSKTNKAHLETAKKIDDLINKIYKSEADITCERYWDVNRL